MSGMSGFLGFTTVMRLGRANFLSWNWWSVRLFSSGIFGLLPKRDPNLRPTQSEALAEQYLNGAAYLRQLIISDRPHPPT
jgi:hypothetical protein